MGEEESKQLCPHRLTAWYAEYSVRLKAFLWGLLHDRVLVEEALQGTFAKALTQGGTVTPGAEKSWLFQVACNEAMAIHRRQGIHKRSLQQLKLLRHDSVTAEEEFLRREMVHNVRSALEKLPDEQKAVVCKRIYEEKTFQEIAVECDVPLGTVLTRMRLALRKLQKALESEQ